MKKYCHFVFFALSILLMSCESEQLIILRGDSIDFKLFNYSDDAYQNAELLIGGIDSDNQFIATDSIRYAFVPSNVSPTGAYTNLDNCAISCGNDGLIDGFHYFIKAGEEFVQIPFSQTNNTWFPNLNDILEISDTMAFVFRLPDGTEKRIGGFNLRTTFVENEVPIHAETRIFIRDDTIEGGTFF